MVNKLDELATKDKRSRAWIIREAVKEYLTDHYPGNPQTDLRIFPADDGSSIPPPKTIAKAESRFIEEHAGSIAFLMKTKNIPQEEAVEIIRRLYQE